MSIEKLLEENTAGLNRLAAAIEQANAINSALGNVAAGKAEKPASEKPAKPAPKAAPAPTPPTAGESAAPASKAAPSEGVTYDDIKAAFLKLDDQYIDAVQGLFDRYGIAKLNALDASQYDAFYADLSALQA